MSSYLRLAQEIEYVQINRRLDYIEAQTRLHPEYNCHWRRIGDGFTLYAGPGSPVNRTMGLGLQKAVSESDIQSVEEFFDEVKEPTRIDLCPFAHDSLLKYLNGRDFTISHLDQLLVTTLPPSTGTADASPFNIVMMDDANRQTWIEIIATAFSDEKSECIANRDVAMPTAFSANYTGFLAYFKSKPIGAGGIYLRDGLAELAPDGTLPSFRQQGVQMALMKYRLNYAVAQGCRLVTVACAPGISTQSNAEKLGFKTAYTKPVMIKLKPGRPKRRGKPEAQGEK